jgi:GAF domain-containing protein
MKSTANKPIDHDKTLKLLQQREAELAVINSVQEGLVAEMDMQGIYDLVGKKIRDLFDSQVTMIATFDHESKKEHFKYFFEDGQRHYAKPRTYNKLRQQLIDTKKLICINEDAAKASEVVPETQPPKSMVFVPLVIGNSVKGYVSLQNLDREHAFSDADVRLLGTLANSLSVALENARLFSETEQRNAELAVINSVQEGLVAEMDMQGIYDLVGDRIQELFDAQSVLICTFDHESDLEHFQYNYEDGSRIYPEPRPLDKFRKKLINTKELILINEKFPQEAAKFLGNTPKAVPGTELPKAVLFVPLIVGDSVRGYVSLQNLDREHAFSDSDVRLLGTLANSMSVALENARLFNETEQRNAELAVINSVQQGLVAEMDMQGIYDLVGNRLQELFDAQVVGINTIDLEQEMEHFKYAYEEGEVINLDPLPLDKLRKHLVETKKMIWISENISQKWTEITGEPPTAVPGTRMALTALYVPMMVGDTVRGYVTLQNLDHENAFDDSDVRLLNTLVNSMSVALENARLFNETTRLLAETEQRNAELAVINSVQEGLVREMDLQAIYDLVGDRICDVLNTQSLLIRTFDHKKGLENWEYVIESGERLYSEPRPFIWANKRLIESKESLVINENYVETAQKFGGKGVTKGRPPKSAIFVPMIVGHEVIGSVSSQNVEEEQAFSESDVRLLTTLTNSMSVAIENARLFNETSRLLAETEQRATELDTVNRISRALVSQLEFDALVRLVGEQMRETFRADIVYLAMHNKETNMLHFPYIYGEEAESRPFGNGITEKIITKKEPLLINHDMDKAYDKLKADRKGVMMQSFLGVPIIIGKEAIGVISVQSIEEENRFNEYDQRLLSTIAANVAVAIQNAEAYQNLQEALTELKSAQEQLVQQEKLASLGQLTAGIAHEIKNPLNFVNNFSDVSIELVQEIREEMNGLEKSDITDEVGFILSDVEANLKKILEHGRRADGIVKSMLLHSRGKSGERIPTDLNKLLDEYVKLAYHGMRATNKSFNIDIKTDFDESLEVMDLVAQDLSRAFLNIINNAMYAAYEYAGETKSREPVIEIKTQDSGKNIEIRIRDNGPGIPEKIREKIFEPFFTTKPTGEGTGLGLSMTYDIISLHKGTLQIETEPGEFTEFIITLPKN